MDHAAWEQALVILGPAATAVTAGDKSIVTQAALSDPWLIAAEIADLFAMRAMATGGVTEFTAEGATFKKTRADWVSLASALRAKAGQPSADDYAFVVAPARPPQRPELTGMAWTF